MSYQVLARKWRPATFTQMVGQEHVLKALVNALDAGRLHHAYLFTGTRGVGKTSIARLFAKALNCEEGVSAEPCGQCASCQAIAEGRFVDLIEVDAASRTKVEDTRELLENVQYAPTQGRYKVYLIDEVHMLSSHSFNALLKTLEEPPPHIKFLLATTDPQKLPVTILSRCLQFNLKNMSPERVVEHLQHVLNAEQVQYEEPALWLLGRAANGSMRDAMSLTDQAISFGDGAIKEDDVRAMLGSVDHQQVLQLLQQLAERQPENVMQAVANMAEYGVDYDDVLAELISVLHRVAMGQMLPGSVDNSLGDQAQILALAKQLKPEDVQLFYQIALNGRKDLPLVPVPREGLEMTLLRMMAFRPFEPGDSVSLISNDGPSSAPSPVDTSADLKQSVEVPVGEIPATATEPTTAIPNQASAVDESPETPVVATVDHQHGQNEQGSLESSLANSESSNSPAEAPANPVPDLIKPSFSAGTTAEQAMKQPTATVNSAAATLQQGQDSGSTSSVDALDNLGIDNSALDSSALDSGAPDVDLSTEEVSAFSTPMDDPPPWGDAPPWGGAEPQHSGGSAAASNESALAANPPVTTDSGGSGKKPQPPEVQDGSQASGDQTGKPEAESKPAILLETLEPVTWIEVIEAIGISGMTYNIAANMTVTAVNGDMITFAIAKEQYHLMNDVHRQRVEQQLSEYFSTQIRIAVNEEVPIAETPAQFKQRRQRERLAQAQQAIANDSVVQQLIDRYGARVDQQSIKPLG